jgi:hypothetical protein
MKRKSNKTYRIAALLLFLAIAAVGNLAPYLVHTAAACTGNDC